MKAPTLRRLGQTGQLSSSDQRGFIPMIVAIIIALVGVMYFAYTRVLHAQQ